MKKSVKWLISILAVSVFVMTGCSGKSESKEKKVDQVLNIGIEAELSTADVSMAMDDTACKVMSQVAEGLYSFGNKGEATPALAEKVVEPTNDGKTYTFKIRKGAKWSNGEPITAQDFEYSWKRTVTPETTSPQAYYFEGIKNCKAIEAGQMKPDELGVKALDDQTLEVDLEYPMSYFQQLLAVPAFFPLNQKFVEKTGKDYGTTADKTLFNGPFVMKKWDGVSSSWSYAKNKNYWDKKHVKLNKINVQVVKEISTGKNLFDTDQLDYVQISGETVAQEQDNKNLKIRKLPGTYYIQLNTKNKVFANVDARKAVALALDSDKLAKKVLDDGSQKALGLVPTGFVNQSTGKDFAKEVGDINPTDTTEAKKLWKKAKSELGIDSAKVSILCSDTDNSKKVSEYIQGALSENLDGLEVTVSAVPFNNRLTKSRSGDFDIALGGWTPVYADPIDFLNLFQSDNDQNFGKWSSATYDKLVADANNTYANDYDKRWEAMKEADKIVEKEAPLVPVYQMSEAYLVSSKIKNLVLSPLGSVYYKNVSIK